MLVCVDEKKKKKNYAIRGKYNKVMSKEIRMFKLSIPYIYCFKNNLLKLRTLNQFN